MNQPPALSNPNLLPNGGFLHNSNQSELAHNNTRPNAPIVTVNNQNIHTGQAWMSQPNSATFKTPNVHQGSNAQGSSNLQINTTTGNARPVQAQHQIINPALQKMSISSQSSLGSVPKSNMPLILNQPIKHNSKGSALAPPGYQMNDQQVTRSSSVKTTDISHSTHNKLQSTELIDNVKGKCRIINLILNSL